MTSSQPLRVAANLSLLFADQGGLLTRYRAAADAGFKFVEGGAVYAESAEALSQTLDNAGLKQVLINAPQGDIDLPQGGFGFACHPDKKDEFADSIKQAIAYAKALRCHRIHVMAGKMQPNVLAVEAEENYLANLKLAAEMTFDEGITCLIEPISKYAVPDYFLCSYDQAVGYLQRLSSLKVVNVKLQLDFFHCQLIRGQLTNAIDTLLPYTGHVQIAQAPHRRDPGSAGEVDFAYVLAYLAERGYDGYIGAEYVPHLPTVQTLDWIGRFQLAVQ